VETPPKISEVPPKTVAVEVLPPEPTRPVPPPPASEGAPIHPLSALTLVAVDSLWIPGEFLFPIWLFAVPACFVVTFIPTYLIQRHLRRDTTGRAITFATLLAILAALPTPIMGTPVGLGLLAWTGLGKWFGKSTPK
jgi:hypothetical protein